MTERQKVNHDRARQMAPSGEDGGGHDTTEVRRAAERFLAAADEAIERALSGDSEAFLAASRQTSAQ